MSRSRKRLWIGLFVLALLTPLGVIVPEKFNSGGAWGEWGPKELEKLAGYMPDGLRRLADLWKAPLRNYAFVGEGASMTVRVLSYLASGFVGILAIGLIIYLIARIIVRDEK